MAIDDFHVSYTVLSLVPNFRIKPKTLCKLDKDSTTDLHLQH